MPRRIVGQRAEHAARTGCGTWALIARHQLVTVIADPGHGSGHGAAGGNTHPSGIEAGMLPLKLTVSPIVPVNVKSTDGPGPAAPLQQV